MSTADALLLLDRPSPDSITSSLAQLHSSSAPDEARLLQSAVYAPAALSSSEIDLLRRHFWPSHEHDVCHAAWVGALAKLESDTSEKHVFNTVERLRKVREKLAGDEEKAFEAAQRELVRRLMSATIVPKASWGYAVYYEADAGADNEDSKVRVTASLQWARDVSAVAKNVQGIWALHRIEWPAGCIDRRKCRLFERLRRYFQMVRGTLPDGILQNVFLVVDRDSVHSVLSGPKNGVVCDDMWAWAVDPEYRNHRQDDQDTAQEEQEAFYPGYMRVRLQQLVHNFYEARRSDKGNMVTLETLWACAQESHERAFVSVREKDFQKWVSNRDVGSCLRQ